MLVETYKVPSYMLGIRTQQRFLIAYLKLLVHQLFLEVLWFCINILILGVFLKRLKPLVNVT